MFSLSDLSILVEHVTPGLNRKRLYVRPLQFAFACTYLEKRLNAIKICNFDPGKHKLADFHAMDPGLKVCIKPARGKFNSFRFNAAAFTAQFMTTTVKLSLSLTK